MNIRSRMSTSKDSNLTFFLLTIFVYIPYIRTHQRETVLFFTLYLPFSTEWSYIVSWVLWNLLLCMKPSDALQNGPVYTSSMFCIELCTTVFYHLALHCAGLSLYRRKWVGMNISARLLHISLHKRRSFQDWRCCKLPVYRFHWKDAQILRQFHILRNYLSCTSDWPKDTIGGTVSF